MGEHTRIGRRVYTTVCNVVTFDDNNEMKRVEVHLYGNINDKERATAKVAKKLGTNRVIVEEMETTSKYYSMTIEAFVEHADSITD